MAGGQVTCSNGTGASSMRAAQGPGPREAAPATAQSLPVGAGVSYLQGGRGRGVGAALRLAQHPHRSKHSVQVWEKVSGLQDWLVAQPLCPRC